MKLTVTIFIFNSYPLILLLLLIAAINMCECGIFDFSNSEQKTFERGFLAGVSIGKQTCLHNHLQIPLVPISSHHQQVPQLEW